MKKEKFLEYKNKAILNNDFYYYDVVRINIRKYRRMRDLTQEQLSELVNISLHYLAQIELGSPKKYYPLELLGRIADVLKIPIKDFFETNSDEDF